MDTLHEISSSIRTKREVLNLSQKRLARLVRMSQSTIARIENDIERLNPSYETIFKVVNVLDRLGKMEEKSGLQVKTAQSIMQKRIVFARPGDTVAETIKAIKNYDFPRLPVLNKEMNVMGAVSQKRVMDIATKDPESLDKIRVSDIIDTELPQVGVDTEFSKIKRILEDWDAVMVVEKGRAVGIITIYDILKQI
jgi:predicted transcriptional regulator